MTMFFSGESLDIRSSISDEGNFNDYFYNETINELKKMPVNSYVSTYIALNEDITIKDFSYKSV